MRNWVHLMEFPNEDSPVAWRAPNGETWYFMLIEMPFMVKGIGYGTDFVWLRVKPDEGLPNGFREPRIAGFRTKPADDTADWWKSDRSGASAALGPD